LIASRDHLCVNSAINIHKGQQLSSACRTAQKGLNPCVYYKNREQGSKDMTWDPLDIEELHTMAKRHQFCPYFGAKDRANFADLIFMPYNYLIDEKIRESYKISLENCVLIFDEAHNIT